MSNIFFPLTIITRVFENETSVSEALNFPEVSRFGKNEDKLREAIRANVEEILKDLPTPSLHTRIAQSDIEITEHNLEIEPPKKSKLWHDAIKIKFHALQWLREDGIFVAYIPTLDIAILTKDKKEIEARIEKEIQSTLKRTEMTKSLGLLRWLERCQEVRIERNELSVKIPTPKQIATAKKDEKEKTVLSEIGINLDLQPAYEVEETVALLAEALKSKHAKSILLVGQSGVGKTAIFLELVRTKTKYNLERTPFAATSGARIVAGMSGFGMWQERCQKLVAEVAKEKTVLHLGNLVELMEVGKSTHNMQGIASFLKPKLARGEISVIVECTPEQLPVIEREVPQLLSVFHQIKIESPSNEKVLKILMQVSTASRTDAIETIAQLHNRYATYSAAPGRHVRFLRNLLNDNKEFSTSDVLKAFSNETGLPLFLLSDDEPLDLEKTKQWFDERVLGQTEASRLILDLIATVKARLTRPRRPIASLLFIGPTGVGKTEMVKSLAEFFFQDKNRMVRFDMSEYADEIAVKRLIGGVFGNEGVMTAKVREQPFAVVLLDEFEKAHPLFFDLLLQILGEGRLTDAGGRVADFTNTIIVMTSNLGATDYQRGGAGFLKDANERREAMQHFTKAVRQFLRPEIFNRIDRIVPFAPLSKEIVGEIAKLELNKIKKRDRFRYKNLTLNLSDDVLKFLVERGYDARYGARPLKRAIERELLAPLSEELNKQNADDKLIAEAFRVQPLGCNVYETKPLEETTKLKVDVSIATDKKGRRAAVTSKLSGLYQVATNCGEVRRKLQRLVHSTTLREFHDEVFRLQELERRILRSKWISPEDSKRVARLPFLKEAIEKTKLLSESSAELEDLILLDLYGKAETVRPELREALEKVSSNLKALLLELLALKYVDAEKITLGAYSENKNRLWQMVRAYFDVAEKLKLKIPNLVSFTTDGTKLKPSDIEAFEQNESGWKEDVPREWNMFGRVVTKKEIVNQKDFLSKPQEKVVGVLFEFEGTLAQPRLSQEEGRHVFISQSQTDQVLIHTSEADWKNYLPPTGLQKRGSIGHQTKRRTYNKMNNLIKDNLLEDEFDYYPRTFNEKLFELIEERLNVIAEELID
jgi:ATP-dependent Clp protease ATP-binding subunit ClpA